MAGLNPDRAGDFLSVQFEFDNVFDFDLEALRHLGADEHGVVPSELGHRLGEFLQPAVVGELSVVNGGVATDVELDGAGVRLRRLRSTRTFRRYGFWSECCSFNPAIVQRFAPESFKVPAVLFLPIGTNQMVAVRVSLPGEKRDKFRCALAAI